MATRSELDTTTLVENTPLHLRWGSIIGGTVAALGVWMLLYALGLALGLSSMDPNDPSSARGAGIFTGIWGLIAPLIALFVGGMVASRGSGTVARQGAAIHGLVMWGLTMLAGAYFLATVLGSVLGTVASAGKAAAGAAGSAVSSAAGAAQGNAGGLQNLAQSFGLDAQDALRPVNERLAAEGKPTITAAQLEAAVKDVVRTGVTEGNLDRQLLVSSIAQNTALSQQDSQEIANRVEAQFNEAKGQAQAQLQEVKQDVQTGALQAADATGKAMWGVFGALLLGLVSSILGAVAGVSKQRKVAVAARRTDFREVHP